MIFAGPGNLQGPGRLFTARPDPTKLFGLTEA